MRHVVAREINGGFRAYLPLALTALLASACTDTESGGGPFTPLGDASVQSTPDAAWFGDATGLLPTSPNPDNPAEVVQGAIPSDVCQVLRNNGCMDCHHARPTSGGAPMPLTMRADFTGNALDGSPLAQKLLARMQDAKNPMPPQSTSRPLASAADVARMKSWIEGGMSAVEGTACTAAAATNGSDAGVIERGVSWATRGWPEGQCDYVVTLGAHNDPTKPLAQDPTPFDVPNKETHYECFYEKVPWGPNEHVQAIAMRVRIEEPDDKAIVHHLVVSGQKLGNTGFGTAKPNGPGDHKPCLNPNGSTMGIWAPGVGNPATFPEDVGLLLPSGDDAYFELQVHYNTPGAGGVLAGPAKKSKVRYDVCVTKKLKPNEAGVFWLGYENTFLETLLQGEETTRRLDNQNNGTAIGKCSAKAKARILTIMPHMHELGVHSKFEIISKSGTKPIVDMAYDFKDQPAYPQENLWVEQGDVVRTTCKWSKGPVYFGFGSDNEMCFFYTLAYPISAFQALPFLGERNFVGGDMACAGASGP